MVPERYHLTLHLRSPRWTSCSSSGLFRCGSVCGGLHAIDLDLQSGYGEGYPTENDHDLVEHDDPERGIMSSEGADDDS